jgi:hypothetical protein
MQKTKKTRKIKMGERKIKQGRNKRQKPHGYL